MIAAGFGFGNAETAVDRKKNTTGAHVHAKAAVISRSGNEL